MIWGNLVLLADVTAILPLGLQLVVLFFLAGVIASCFVFFMADGDVVAICLMFVLAYVIAICFCGCWYYHFDHSCTKRCATVVVISLWQMLLPGWLMVLPCI